MGVSSSSEIWYIIGADAVPNSELVSQMLEEALEGDDMTSVVNRQRSK